VTLTIPVGHMVHADTAKTTVFTKSNAGNRQRTSMIKLKGTTFGKIKRGRTFYRLAQQFKSMPFLLRIKTGQRSAKFVGDGMCTESLLWRPSERVYVRERC
jgi:hypothetical protein